MFATARVTLTLWYLLIIMVISLLFSFVIYTNVNAEFSRIERFEKVRQQERDDINSAIDQFRNQTKIPSQIPKLRRLDSQMIQQSRMRLIVTLGIVDGAILLLAGFIGYFLAGRTLQPIKLMMDEQNRFITDASHELRTPLTSLKSSIEVHLRDKKLSVLQAKNVLESNLEEVNALQALSDNLIQLTQYPNGAKKSFEKMQIDSIVTEAIKKVSGIAKNKEITITRTSAQAVVFGDKASLVELIIILLENAIKYSNTKTTITIKTKLLDGKVVVEITDEGMGIDEKDIPHIFDRFYRSDKSRSKTETAGYGLGLSIAKHLANLHNGSIHVQSILGTGSTFTVMLPKA